MTNRSTALLSSLLLLSALGVTGCAGDDDDDRTEQQPVEVKPTEAHVSAACGCFNVSTYQCPSWKPVLHCAWTGECFCSAY